MISIIGAGGHTRTLINLLRVNHIQIGFIYEDESYREGEIIEGIPVKHISEISKTEKLIVSKGNPSERLFYYNKFKKNLLIENIIHPRALIETQNLGEMNQISPNTFLANTAKIGDDNIIYSGTNIEHEVELGNHNVITVNVTICGRVKIGNNCLLGASSTILPNLSVCDNVIIGAGAVVTKSINKEGIYTGVPAKRTIK